MNEVNNFASVNFGHCEKSKHFALDLGIFLGSKTKCLDFPQCPQITDAQLLTSNSVPILYHMWIGVPIACRSMLMQILVDSKTFMN